MKYYATITHSTGQFENGSESIRIYEVVLETGNKVPAGDDGDEILKGGGW